MTIVTGPDSNRLLAKLLNVIGVAEMAPKLERVRLKSGQLLHDVGVSLSHVYFATDALISLLQVMQCGEVTETALVGNDGMVGSELMMGIDRTPNRAVVQCDGLAYRLPIESFSAFLQCSVRARELVLAQARALMVQTAQTVACNRHHTLNQQFCRWMLLALDRLPSTEIRMTHEHLAQTLGVRRESVTLAATRLRDEGAIEYSRGRIHVLDRNKLEQHVCECYGIVRRECDRQAGMFEFKASGITSVETALIAYTGRIHIEAADRRRGDRRQLDRRTSQLDIAFPDRREHYARRAEADTDGVVGGRRSH